jgi:hypothetical protein
MKVLRACAWLALVLIGTFVAARTAQGQNQDPDQTPKSGGNMMNIPMHPGGGPDPYAKYMNDPTVGVAQLEQERLNSRIRQKQLTEATELLLKIARDLRVEMAANPNAALTEGEMQQLKLVEKLAKLIQDREKAADQVSAALAKAGKAP